MYNVLISREIPSIAREMLLREGLSVYTLKENENLTSLNKTYLKNAEAIISMLFDQIDSAFLDQCPNLKVVTNYAVGVNNFDLDELQKRKILIGHTPDALTEATAELTVALLLQATRNIHEATKSLYEGRWRGFSPLEFLGPTVFRKKVAIFGMGRIGKKVGQILHFGFQCQISTLDRKELANQKVLNDLNYAVEFFDEKDFLENCDFLILTAPLNEQTKNWLNIDRLNLLRKNCLIINTGRGGIVDEDAIIEALSNNVELIYASDVFTIEPLPLNHPFLKLKNAVLFPHLGSATIEARTAMAEICAKNIVMGLKERKVQHSPV